MTRLKVDRTGCHTLCSIFIRGQNLHDLEIAINRELNNVNVWWQCNRLTLNISKSLYVTFGNRAQGLNISINDINLVLLDNCELLCQYMVDPKNA